MTPHKFINMLMIIASATWALAAGLELFVWRDHDTAVIYMGVALFCLFADIVWLILQLALRAGR
jgi:hypothetical protein